jgi:phosphoserine phosphatase
VIATRAKIDAEGRYTGAMEFYAYAEGKAEAIRELATAENLVLPDSFAYSDSVTDLPMLEAVGHPVVVNPDKELAQIAEERDWQTMDFDRPVTIRTRLATLPKPVPLISGAVLAGAIGGAVVLWAIRTRQKLS